VQRRVLAQTLGLVAIGVGIGVTASLILGRLAASLLFDVAPADPLTYIGTVLVLFTAALVAAWMPAIRASRVDPMSALRTS
jgi:ABC-type antimicrobial peptide transport system permease subunit